jgi:ribosomal protein L40E
MTKGDSIMATTAPESIPFERSHHPVLRFFGAIIVVLGVLLTVVGALSLFSSWGTIGGSRYYWAPFLGLPLIALGSAFAQSENLTSDHVDLSDERTPRTADQTTRGTVVACERCHATNPSAANFCNQCGTSLAVPTCPGCGARITRNARFCTHCGKTLVWRIARSS